MMPRPGGTTGKTTSNNNGPWGTKKRTSSGIGANLSDRLQSIVEQMRQEQIANNMKYSGTPDGSRSGIGYPDHKWSYGGGTPSAISDGADTMARLTQQAQDRLAAAEPDPKDRTPGDGYSDPYQGMDSLIQSQYDQGLAALQQAALGGRNDIGAAGKTMQASLAALIADANKQQAGVGADIRATLRNVLAKQGADQDRVTQQLALRGAVSPSTSALFASSRDALNQQMATADTLQNRMREIFGGQMAGMQGVGHQITGGALSTLATNEEKQRAALEAQRADALASLVQQRASARSRGGGGSGGSGGSDPTDKFIQGQIKSGIQFDEFLNGGYINPYDIESGVDSRFRKASPYSASRIEQTLNQRRRDLQAHPEKWQEFMNADLARTKRTAIDRLPYYEKFYSDYVANNAKSTKRKAQALG